MICSRLKPAPVLYAVGLLLSAAAVGAEGKLFIYPAKGQTQEQLADDRYECHLFAVKQSGFDPTRAVREVPATPVAEPVGENEKAGATAKGALAGAAAGAVIGAHDDNVPRGAAVGAAVGGALGAAVEAQGERAAREAARARAEEEARRQARRRADLDQQRQNYHRAVTACMEGRGYTVR